MQITRSICKGEPPGQWEGTHYLVCLHSLNSRSKIRYLMYCNVIKPMRGGRLKILVFGNRYVSLKGSRIRYVGKEQVVGNNGWLSSKGKTNGKSETCHD